MLFDCTIKTGQRFSRTLCYIEAQHLHYQSFGTPTPSLMTIFPLVNRHHFGSFSSQNDAQSPMGKSSVAKRSGSQRVKNKPRLCSEKIAVVNPERGIVHLRSHLRGVAVRGFHRFRRFLLLLLLSFAIYYLRVFRQQQCDTSLP